MTATLIPWIPALAAGVIGLISLFRDEWNRFAGALCAGAIGISFLLTITLWGSVGDGVVEHAFYDWISFGGGQNVFHAGFSWFVDPLTIVMLLVITGIGGLIAVYATGYMKGDPGYWRFFVYVSLFIFAMTTLVMADNLLLLFLGWEGVGLCSYLLIGYYYEKPVAVAAAKKAFIVNRIGDFGFLLGIFLCYRHYGTLEISAMLDAARETLAAVHHGHGAVTATDLWIPFLLMVGAFGKSAQLPLYVWLPDAMAGPTPVSALVHAATMVTAGVYLIARCLPLFELSPYALPTVATVGAVTALFAATIALTSNDLKGVFAYSTVSQLGYMFLGVGCLSTDGAVFHLVTHAFFKALLFLTAGSVMHALCGQLDICKIRGMRHKMPITCWLMFAGCLALAGVPLTAGFFSKDLILGDALAYAVEHRSALFFVLTFVGVVTAFLTAFYTFRLWFTVFMGDERYEMGDEHHSTDAGAHAVGESHEGATRSEHLARSAETAVVSDATGVEADAAAAPGRAPDHAGDDTEHAPHEMPWIMNGPLVILACGALLAGLVLHFNHGIEHAVAHSTAAPFVDAAHGAEAGDAHAAEHHATFMGLDAHVFMQILSSLLAVAGVGLAAVVFWLKRDLADTAATRFDPLIRFARHEYCINEMYAAAIVEPLRRLGSLFYAVDRLIINSLMDVVGFAPRLLGLGVRPAQNGRIQSYGLGMVLGVAVLAVVVLMATS